MITSYWSSRAIAHLLFSFGFTDGQHVVFSVEIRRERGEVVQRDRRLLQGVRAAVIAADERDIVAVRTNVRGEDDYLYRLRLPAADIRSLFLAYLEQSNQLVSTPRFYNTVTVNCTTLVYRMLKHIVGALPFSYRVLFSGYLPEYVYSLGGLDGRYPLTELRELGQHHRTGANAPVTAKVSRPRSARASRNWRLAGQPGPFRGMTAPRTAGRWHSSRQYAILRSAV